MHPSPFVSAAVLLPCVRYRFLLCPFMCRLGLAMAYGQVPEQYEIKYISTENGLNYRIIWPAFQGHQGAGSHLYRYHSRALQLLNRIPSPYEVQIKVKVLKP